MRGVKLLIKILYLLSDISSREWNYFLKQSRPGHETIILNGTLGKTNYYAIRVEFQVRGSPHVRSFIWILNSPKLTKSNIEEYTS